MGGAGIEEVEPAGHADEQSKEAGEPLHESDDTAYLAAVRSTALHGKPEHGAAHAPLSTE
jgi:hypothetical protein